MTIFKRFKYGFRILAAAIAGLAISCKPVPVSHWFPVTPREHYEKELYQSKFEKTTAGQTWLRVGEASLGETISASAPYQERFYLGDSLPAQSIRIHVPQGRKLIIRANREDGDTLSHMFAELYKVGNDNKPRRLEYLKQGSSEIAFTNQNQDTLLLRLQAGLLEKVAVTISLNTLPTLAFPVASHGMSDIISYWGAERDRGVRSHEGVDIRAKRGTPVIAAQSGFVTQAGTNNLGGKVLFVSSLNNPYSIYYAHLDSQLVGAGRQVTAGDTIGLVGNTGNAITTSPHLHFGIYARGSGAIDPLPFINDKKEKIRGLPETSQYFGDTVRITRKTNLFSSPELGTANKISALPADTPVRIIGEMSKGYRVQLLEGTKGYIPTVPLRKKSLEVKNVSARSAD